MNGSDTRWLAALTRRGWAWEFLRRSPLYRESFALHRISEADAALWGLLRYEDSNRDARSAVTFWRVQDCPSVLPLTVLPNNTSPPTLAFRVDHLTCKVDLYHHNSGDQTDILFHEEGRFLQVSVSTRNELNGAFLYMPAIDTSGIVTARAAAFRRFNDLLQHGSLRKSLYPLEPRAPRLMNVLKALDGSLAGLSHREIATLIFSKERVETDWGRRQHHLRDKVRRAIAYGQSLADGNYRQFLRPTYSRQIARPGTLHA